MAEHIVMAIVYFSTPAVFVLVGFLMYKLGRGYNSFSRAVYSVEAQNFGARYCGRMFMLFSIPFAIASVVFGVITVVQGEALEIVNVFFWIWMGLLIVLPVIPFIMTEVKIRKHFDKQGKPYR